MFVGRAAGEAAFLGGELESFFAVEPGLAHEFVNAFREALRGFASAIGFGLVGRGHDESNLALCRPLGERSGEFGEASVAKFFVELGDFAG